jgi:cytochrome P450
MGWGFNLGLMPYGPRWRRHRRVFHDHFNPGVISKYHPTLHRETRALLRRLLETPEDFMRHIRQ